MPVRLALSGYYGCGNTGDEAVLAGIVESFARRAGSDSARLTVLSADPADTERRHGLRAVPRMRLGVVRQALRESDLLLSGGGSLLQDATSLRSLIYYVAIIRLARMMRRPVMFYAQGIGPLRRPIARRLVRSAADRAQCITVRDSGSAALLKQIGVTTQIEVTADPAFAIRPVDDEDADVILAESGVPPDRPVIGIALRWPVQTQGVAERLKVAGQFAGMVEQAARLACAHVLFLPMQLGEDDHLADHVAQLARVESSAPPMALDPAVAVAVMRRLDGLIAMRLHALIFGAMGGVPMAAIGYDPKVESLMGRLGQAGRLVPLAGFSADAAAHTLADAMAEGPVLRSALRARAEELAELALVNVDRALAVAGTKSGRTG